MKTILTIAMMVLAVPMASIAGSQDSVKVTLAFGSDKFVHGISIQGDANSLAGRLYEEMKKIHGETVCGIWCGGFARVNGLKTINTPAIELQKHNAEGTSYALQISPRFLALQSSISAKSKVFAEVDQFSNENVGQLLIREQGGRAQLTITGELADSFKTSVDKKNEQFVNDLQTLDQASSLVKCQLGKKSKNSLKSNSICIFENK